MISPGALLIVLLLLSATAYYLGLRRSVAVVGGRRQVHQLHSRPAYYGMLTALWCCLPALLIFCGWQAFEGKIITQLVVSDLPAELQQLPADRINLLVISRHLERLADHATNIAEEVVYLIEGEIVRHGKY